MKKMISLLLLTIFLLGTLSINAVYADETTITAEKDGVVLTVTFDKSEYNIGDTVKATAVLKNNSDKSIYFHRDGDLHPLFMDIKYDDKGNYLCGSDSIEVPPATIVEREIKPGEESSAVITFFTRYTDINGSKIIDCEAGEYAGKAWAAYSLKEGDGGIENDTELSLNFTLSITGVRIGERNYTEYKDGLSLSVSLDKSEYLVGEDITVTVILKNNNDKSVYYRRDEIAAHNDVVVKLPYGQEQQFIDTDDGASIPTVVDRELSAGESITEVMRFKSGYRMESLLGLYDEDDPFIKANPGTYAGKAIFEYSFDKGGENTSVLSLNFGVSIISDEVSFTAYDGGVALVVTFDKSKYNIGDTVKATAVLKNNSGESIYFHRYAPHPIFMYIKYDDNGNYFLGSDSIKIPPEMTEWEIKPGEELSDVFTIQTKYDNAQNNTGSDFIDCEAGEYLGKAWALYSRQKGIDGVYDELSLDFTVSLVAPTVVDADVAVSAVAAGNSLPKEGEELTLSATLRNYGEETYTGNVSVDFYKNGKLITTVTQKVELDPDGYVVITADKASKFAFGSQTMYAAVTCDSAHKDVDPANNMIKSRIIVE